MRIFTVGEITARIRDLLARDPALQDVWVEGEVSNFQRASSGHVYFTLKDQRAAIPCVAWRSDVAGWPYLPRDGEAILAHGRVSVYEERGRYQLYVDWVERAGVGALYLQFLALKERLEAEGLFAPERKRPLPPFPRVVGVVTSPQAAAYQDILRVLRHRFPGVEVVLAPTLVQGEEAPDQIVQALQALNALDEVDVILVARGGGSLEELWAFNDERVARAIAASRHPVVTGIGHETDLTLADLAADVRAPTPSAAAAAVVPDGMELRAQVAKWTQRLQQHMGNHIARRRSDLQALQRTLAARSPAHRLAQQRQQVDEQARLLVLRLEHRLALLRRDLGTLEARLASADPRAILARGYAVVQRAEDGRLVRSVRQVQPGDALRVHVSDGQFGAQATHVAEPDGHAAQDPGED
ncbi:MAG: exodeoxyribonuclease VII large subunit [Anaerolineae bacterium]|nr:exodeoxyribonuclease VII large subunit [Anaerolineae bacterium]